MSLTTSMLQLIMYTVDLMMVTNRLIFYSCLFGLSILKIKHISLQIHIVYIVNVSLEFLYLIVTSTTAFCHGGHTNRTHSKSQYTCIEVTTGGKLR